MKKIIALGIFLTVFVNTYSQYHSLKQLDFIEENIPYFEFTGLGTNQIYIEMNFGLSKIEDFSFIDKLKMDNKITRIELLYTDYPKGINLVNLNNRRFNGN